VKDLNAISYQDIIIWLSIFQQINPSTFTHVSVFCSFSPRCMTWMDYCCLLSFWEDKCLSHASVGALWQLPAAPLTQSNETICLEGMRRAIKYLSQACDQLRFIMNTTWIQTCVLVLRCTVISTLCSSPRYNTLNITIIINTCYMFC